MSITIGKHGDIVVLDVGEQLVIANGRELEQAILLELDRGERQFRLDFSGDSVLAD